MERLEKIVRQIDNNELDIDILSEKIKEANEIIAFARINWQKLTRKSKNYCKKRGYLKNKKLFLRFNAIEKKLIHKIWKK